MRVRLKPKRSRSGVRELAQALEVDETTVRRALRDPTFPLDGESGNVDEDEARTWFRARAAAGRRRGDEALDAKESKAVKSYGGGDPDPAGGEMRQSIARAQAEYRSARAQAETIRIQRLRGELIERAQVAQLMAGWARQFAKALQLVEGRMASALSAEARARLQKEHRAVLTAFAAAGEDMAT